MNNNFLTIEEKRAWLARIFRDTSGEYTAADKLKALEADIHLVALQKPTVKENLTLQVIFKNHEIKPHKRNKKYRKRTLIHRKHEMKPVNRKLTTPCTGRTRKSAAPACSTQNAAETRFHRRWSATCT